MYTQEETEPQEYSGHEETQIEQELPIEEEGEEPEEQPEPEEEAEPIEASEPPKKKKQNIGERLSQIQREKYQALDEVRRMREENEQLRQMANTSTQTALNHYDQAVQQRMQAAKEQKIKALESGDIQAQTDADAALSLAAAELYDMNMRKAEYETYKQPQYQQQQQPYIPPQQDPEVQYKVRRFVDENSWFNPQSDDYDPELASHLNGWCNQFERNMQSAGRGNEIYSDDYMYEVNKAARELYTYKHQQRGGDLPMKQSRGNVAPVRSSGFQQNPTQSRSGNQQQTKLSPEERDIAKRLGIDDKTYLQYRLADEQTNGHKRVRR